MFSHILVILIFVKKTSSVSNPMELSGFSSCGFLREASSSVVIATQLPLFSFKQFGDIHHCLTQKIKIDKKQEYNKVYEA